MKYYLGVFFDDLNNNFSFAGLNWKIVKINGDGSVKVVLDGLIEEIGKYYDTDYSFSNSSIKVLEHFTSNSAFRYFKFLSKYLYIIAIKISIEIVFPV